MHSVRGMANPMEKPSWPNTVFGTQLRQLRQAANITQEELAFRVGLARTYISLLERGVKSPTLTVFLRLCVALDQPPDQVMAQIYQLVLQEQATGQGRLFPNEAQDPP